MLTTWGLPAALALVVIASFALSPRVRHVEGFFRGTGAGGAAPGLLTLVLSQVTTWIFARSLMNAAILGFYYGMAGALAYAGYYLSFLTGAAIIDGIRFRHGHASIQGFLASRFGRPGTACYNVLVAVRLVSEVFANLLVVGIIFGAAGSLANTAAIAVIAVLTLAYSMLGGLRASLRTDVLQMTLLLGALAALLVQIGLGPGYDLGAVLTSSPDASGPGWVLLAVAALQIWSYPMHDPVMMDRGLLADRRTTRRSFLHAAWLSALCILAFGLIGTQAGLASAAGEALIDTLGRLLDPVTLLLFNLILVISAVSTLDSTLSSASKLAVMDMRLAAPSVKNGRIAMAGFMAAGLLLLFTGSEDLFSAVAVSGTAAMYLAPVIVLTIWLDRAVALWSYLAAFAASMAGAVLYFLEAGGHAPWIAAATGLEHKYSVLLAICLVVLVLGFGAFALGDRGRVRTVSS